MDIYQTTSEGQKYLPFTYHLAWSPEQTGLGHWVNYYGCRYAEACQPSELWETYFTSSVHVKEKCKQWGDPVYREVRKVFHDLIPGKQAGEIVTEYEHRVLRRINAKKRRDFLNRHNGGKGYDTAGLVAATNKVTGLPDLIPMDEFRTNRDSYRHACDDTVAVIEIESGWSGRIDKDEFRTNRHRYKQRNEGVVNVIGGQVTCEEYQANRDAYITASTGKVAAIIIETGESTWVCNEEFHSNRDKYRHTSDGMVKVTDKITGWSGLVPQEEFHSNRHRFKSASDGMVTVTIKATGKTQNVTREEFRANRMEYSTAGDGMVTVTIKATGKTQNVTREEFRKNRHLYQHSSDGMVKVIEKLTGKRMLITQKEFRNNRSRYATPNDGTVTVTDPITGWSGQIPCDIYHANKDRYVTPGVTNKDTVTVKDGFGNSYRVPKDDPLLRVTLIGVRSNEIFCTVVATGERIIAKKEDKRWLTEELVRGW